MTSRPEEAEVRADMKWLMDKLDGVLGAKPMVAKIESRLLAKGRVIEAAEELTAACEAEFMDGIGEADGGWPDEEEVAAPHSNITFGMIRRARAALAACPADPKEQTPDG